LHEDMSPAKRETQETVSLLKDAARRQMQAESSKEGLNTHWFFSTLSLLSICSTGLIILEATYGPSESDDETKDLMIDVTIAIQALVNNSQVYISGHRTKVSETQ
jgi:DnaJ family protein C protein 11